MPVVLIMLFTLYTALGRLWEPMGRNERKRPLN
jgi:hypothetical protein